MNKLSAKFHLATGLTSIVTSVILIAILLGLIPDRSQALMHGRVILAESIASSSTLFLANDNYPGLAGNLEFSIERNDDLLAASVQRENDTQALLFGDASVVNIEEGVESSETRIVLPILQNQQAWGEIVLFFEPPGGSGWLNYLKNSLLTLIAFTGMASFGLFYLYLGRMLKALNPSQAIPGRVRSALDTLAEALLVVDRKANVVLANTAFQQVVGQSADAIIGKNASGFDWHLADHHPADSAETENREYPWQTTLTEKETRRGETLWLKGGDDTWHKFQVNCSPIMTGDKASGVLVSLDDITELEHKERELRLARDAAEQANHAKTNFLSNMSHEIRTPMTAILGFTDVLKRTGRGSDDNWRRHLETISNSGKHLLELINDILDLSKVESGALEVEQIECKPHAVAYDVVQVLAVRAREKSISLDIEIPEPLPEVISSDSSRLRQIITNLVGNAIKFTDSGGVRIVLRLEDANTAKPVYAIDVIDSGIGMNDEQAAAIFKPFVQADSSITRRFGGTGLGLTISKKLAVAMGGDISVKSELNAGTTFTARIAIESLSETELVNPDDLLQSMAQVSDNTENLIWEFPPSKVLVIDDAAENRELITLVLTDLGIESDSAENGAIGVEKASKQHFDVIMSDIQMPVMDGYETAQTLRNNGVTQPIIALTANAMNGYEERILASGFSHYMTKPIDLGALTRLLGELLGGTCSEAPEAHASVESDFTRGHQNVSTETVELIYSHLGESAKLGHVVTRFIDKLHQQIPLMEQAFRNGDYAEIASIAHWLKGSGGTVGFNCLLAPGNDLEQFAQKHDKENVKAQLDLVKSLAGRLRAGAGTSLVEQNVPETVPEIGPETGPEIKSLDTQGTGPVVDGPIESRLAAKNPAFRPIILRFISRLKDQLDKLEEAVSSNDLEEVAHIAHWLKGSGGTVGFDIFTEPAAQMERDAKERININLRELLNQIRHYERNIVVPGNDDDSAAKRQSA